MEYKVVHFHDLDDPNALQNFLDKAAAEDWAVKSTNIHARTNWKMGRGQPNEMMIIILERVPLT